MHTATNYHAALLALLPSGAAWPREPDSELSKLLEALAQEFARIDARANQLLDESLPSQTVELLAEWENDYGLPDSCSTAAQTIAERRAALQQKYRQYGSQSREFLTELAAALGINITITEYKHRCFGDNFGEFWRGQAWNFVVEVEAIASEEQNDIADYLRCVLTKLLHAHKVLLYTVTPARILLAHYPLADNLNEMYGGAPAVLERATQKLYNAWDGLMHWAGIDVPAFTDRGILVEPSETNKVGFATNLLATGWSSENTSVLTTAVPMTLPDGSTGNAYRIRRATGTNIADRMRKFTLTANTKQTLAGFLKRDGNHTHADLYVNRSNNRWRVSLDFEQLSVTVEAQAGIYSQLVAGFAPLSNGWFYLVVQFVSSNGNADTNWHVGARYPVGNPAGEGIYAWLMHAQQRFYASPVLTETASSATRLADILTLPAITDIKNKSLFFRFCPFEVFAGVTEILHIDGPHPFDIKLTLVGGAVRLHVEWGSQSGYVTDSAPLVVPSPLYEFGVLLCFSENELTVTFSYPLKANSTFTLPIGGLKWPTNNIRLGGGAIGETFLGTFSDFKVIARNDISYSEAANL